MVNLNRAIFSNVSEKDHLEFFGNDRPQYGRIANFLKFKRKEISAATEVRLRSIRYDEYMPGKLGKRLIEWVTFLTSWPDIFRAMPRERPCGLSRRAD